MKIFKLKRGGETEFMKGTKSNMSKFEVPNKMYGKQN